MVYFINSVVTIAKKQSDADDADKEGYVTDAGLTSVKLNIQPADAETTVLSEGQFGKAYQAFTSVSGINIGDRVTTISGSYDGRVFYVKGVEDWDYPPLPHYRLVIHATT